MSFALTLGALEWDAQQFFVPMTAEWGGETFCSVLVGIACGVLGCFVVLRRMALIGDALSHAVLPGVVIAFILTASTNVASLLIGALVAGLFCAVSINLVSRYSRTKEDSAIGIVFTALFALGIILISNLEKGTHFDMKCFLFGDPLAVTTSDIQMMAVIAPLVILIIILLYNPLKLISFDPVVAAAMGLPVVLFHYLLMGMLSATVVAGLKTTGVVLVVAMIITPASAAYQLTNRLSVMLFLAGVFGALSALIGMCVAFSINCPSGPAMVLVSAAIFVLAMLFSPKQGVLFDWVRRWRLARHIQIEDILKTVYKLNEQQKLCDMTLLGLRVDMPEAKLQQRVGQLLKSNMLQSQGSQITLTPAGKKRAIEMVRAHRLWETYLADKTSLAGASLHEQAEKLEHAHDLAEQISDTLGQPTTDPHGEPIPKQVP